MECVRLREERMTAKSLGVALVGIEGWVVQVEVGRQDGLPGMDITGLPL